MRCDMLLILTISSLLVSACTWWPSHGKGGYAEHMLPQAEPLPSPKDTRKLNIKNIECIDHKFSILDKNQASQYFPAKIINANHSKNKILRLMQSDLVWLTQQEIARLFYNLEHIENLVTSQKNIQIIQEWEGESCLES